MSEKKRLAIFISGRGSNMEAILNNVKDGILKDYCNVVMVFSNNKDAKGLDIAKRMKIETACIESKGKKRKDFDREVISIIEPLNIDFIVLAGYMRILSEEFIEKFRNRIINIHPADTRLYKGANAYEWAYENKLKSTKITIHYVDEGMDTGEVVSQRDVDLKGAETLEEIKERGLKVEHEFYSKILKKIFTDDLKG